MSKSYAKECQGGVRFGELVVVPATKEHFREIVQDLREEDARELAYATGLPAVVAAARAFALSSKRWAVLQGRRCIALGGAQGYADHEHVAAIWFFGTPALRCVRKDVVRIGLYYTNLLHKEWLCLTNVLPPWVLQERSGMRRLLQRCGFHIHEATPCGPQGRLLHVFMTKKDMLTDVGRLAQLDAERLGQTGAIVQQ